MKFRMPSRKQIPKKVSVKSYARSGIQSFRAALFAVGLLNIIFGSSALYLIISDATEYEANLKPANGTFPSIDNGNYYEFPNWHYGKCIAIFEILIGVVLAFIMAANPFMHTALLSLWISYAVIGFMVCLYVYVMSNFNNMTCACNRDDALQLVFWVVLHFCQISIVILYAGLSDLFYTNAVALTKVVLSKELQIYIKGADKFPKMVLLQKKEAGEPAEYL